jgi:hypothetical protein
MALGYTSLSAAITSNQTQFNVGSTSAITAPNFTTGSGITYLLVDQELMLVTAVPLSGVVTVLRGQGGTRALPHTITTNVISGLPTDFLGFIPAVKAFTMNQPETPFQSSGQIAAAATLFAPSNFFHVTGATGITNMWPPTSSALGVTGSENFVNGTRVVIIFDSTAAIAPGGGGTGPAFATTVAAAVAGNAEEFILDTQSGAALWYPFRKA